MILVNLDSNVLHLTYFQNHLYQYLHFHFNVLVTRVAHRFYLGILKHILLLEYITYLKASTINLSFWLSWFLYIVLELAWQEITSLNLNYPSFKVEYSAPDMSRVYVNSTLLAQRVRISTTPDLKYITYLWPQP